MRRKKGRLLDLEWAILFVIRDLLQAEASTHGFGIAQMLRQRGSASTLVGHGTLYKALARLERWGLLTSEWEDGDVALAERRPRRRLYHLTPAAHRALAAPRRDAVIVGRTGNVWA